MPSSSKTPGAGKTTSSAPKLSLQDEFTILEDQAIDVAKLAGVTIQWAELYPGGELALIIPGGHLCEKCSRPYIGTTCWSCGYEKAAADPGAAAE